MTETLIDRVRSRLDDLGINSFEASRRAGFDRGYVRDLLEGRKKKLLGDGLSRLAAALECDVEYLLGNQEQPILTRETLRFGGTIEAGAWREAHAPKPGAVPAGPDPRFPAHAQSVWRMMGDGADLLDIHHMDLVTVVDLKAVQDETGHTCRHGDVVLLRRERAGLTETSIRQVEQKGAEYWLAVRSSAVQSPAVRCPCCSEGIEQDGTICELVGIVANSARVFGLAQ